MITCCCPTHGRAHVIGEAVESYLRQDPCGVETELLILNDCPEQPLTCDAPGVRIENVPCIPNVNDKFDRCVELARGDWIAWWEDDDISLPHRLARSVMMSGMRTPYKQRNAWFWHDRLHDVGENLFYGASFFPRELYQAAGGAQGKGYPDQNAHMNMLAEIHRRGAWYEMETATPAHVYFVYRWGGPVTHDSGFGAQHADPAARFALFRERTLAHPAFRPGTQRIEPAWHVDYTQAVKEALCRSPQS